MNEDLEVIFGKNTNIVAVQLNDIKPLIIFDERNMNEDGKIIFQKFFKKKCDDKKLFTFLISVGNGKVIEYYTGNTVTLMKNSTVYNTDEELQEDIEQIKDCSLSIYTPWTPVYGVNPQLMQKLIKENTNKTSQIIDYINDCVNISTKSKNDYINRISDKKSK